MTAQILGLNELVVDLTRAGVVAKAQAEQQTRSTIGSIVDTAKSLVPVDTGATRDSISGEVRSESGAVVGEAGAGTKQAIFAEYGTSRTGPQAFMGPALDRHEPGFISALEDAAEF